MSLTKTMMTKAPEVAAQLKLLSNPNRLMIICRLSDGEMSVGDIEAELNIRQPTLSRELGHLRDAGIITPRRQSKVVFYTLTDAPMRQLIEAICETSSGSRRRQNTFTPPTSTSNAIAFNPRPKFTSPSPSSADDRGYSVFASTKKKKCV